MLSDDVKVTELLPCPFCGNKAEAGENGEKAKAELRRLVIMHLRSGWELQGGVSMSVSPSYTEFDYKEYHYSQAMIKPMEEPSE